MTEDVMNLFLLGKQVGFNVGLPELKNMSPEEGFLLEQKVAKAAELMQKNGI